MKKYHPIEFKKPRPYFEQFVRSYFSAGPEDQQTWAGLFKFMEKAQIVHQSRPQEFREKMHAEHQAMHLPLLWAVNGRAIYDFPPLLLDEFANTNLDEVNTSDIHLPFKAVYLHFENTGISFGADAIIGAYISDRPDGAVEVQAVGKISAPNEFHFHHEPIIYEKGKEQTIDALVEQHVFEGLDWSYRHTNMNNPQLENHLTQIRIQEFISSYGFSEEELIAIAGLGRKDSPIKTIGELMTPALEAQVAMRKRFLSLVFNCLLYMSAFPEDRESSFAESGVDPKLAKSYFEGKGKEFTKAKAQVLKSGYTPVITIGNQFEKELSGSGYIVGASSKSAHWRRGHWRRIKDSNNPEVKRLVRVKACRVGFSKDGDGLGVTGHIYQIEEKPQPMSSQDK